MKLKTIFSDQKFMITKIQGIVSIVLLILNLSGMVVIGSDFNIINGFVTSFLVFITVSLIVILLANIYNKYLEMYKHDRSASMKLDPYQVYAFTPFQEIAWRNTFLPLLKIEYRKNPLDWKLRDSILKMEKWLALGYIPKEDFPDHLKKYYITKKEGRIK